MHVVEFGLEEAVVAHACHGHRYRPSSVSLSGTGKKKSEGILGGGGMALACTRDYRQSDRGR